MKISIKIYKDITIEINIITRNEKIFLHTITFVSSSKVRM